VTVEFGDGIADALAGHALIESLEDARRAAGHGGPL
jgi:hypothetical protein